MSEPELVQMHCQLVVLGHFVYYGATYMLPSTVALF